MSLEKMKEEFALIYRTAYEDLEEYEFSEFIDYINDTLWYDPVKDGDEND